MRNGQNKRMRGRNRNNNNRGHNPLTKVFESNGPDVKIRGNASHIAEKYIQLARDAQSSGDPVAAENYYQHAEHYFRLIAAAQEQFRQSPQFNQQNPQGGNEAITGNDMRDGSGNDGQFDDDDGGEDMGQPMNNGEQPQFGTRDPQPYLPRDAQFSDDRQFQQNQQPRQQNHNNGNHQNGGNDGDFNSLPSFITGGGQPQQNNQQGGQGGQGGGYDNGDRNNGNERYGFRRRRHRRGGGGPRNDNQGTQNAQHEGGDDAQ